jgi:hypothetical protein
MPKETVEDSRRASGIIAAYAANRDQGIGNYVTHDSILLGQELCLEEGTAQAEESLFAPQVEAIIQALLAAAGKTADSPVTVANRQFLQVLSALSTGKAPTDAGPVKDEVDKVLAGQGMSASGILPETIDYTQFRVRGYYTRSPELGRYFQTVRYAGTVLFAVKESAATGIDAKQADLLTEQAMQLAGWIAAAPKTKLAYDDYVHKTGLLFGVPDDLILSDLSSVRAIKGTAAQRAVLLAAAKKMGRQPQVLGGVVDIGKLEKGVTASDALTGWRLFPQRRSPDGAAFQQLIFANVREYQGSKEPRSMDIINGQKVKAFPLAMELPALLGSTAAVSALDASDERNFQGYPAAFAKAQKLMAASSDSSSWLPVMRQLLTVKAANPQDSQQLLTTGMAYWTRNRHRSLLYAKQSYTPVAKGMALPMPRKVAYLEPSTGVYKALLGQVQAVSPALKPETAKALKAILEKCILISTKETSNAALAPEEMAFLNDIDAQFLKIAGCEDAPVVVDVHTNPSSQQVLEEAVGYVQFVDFKLPKSETPLRGARLTHAEFRQPMNDRMTDEEWQIRARAAK